MNYRNFKLSIFLAGVATFVAMAGQASAGEELLNSPHFAHPVGEAELETQRGKALPDCNPDCTLGNMTAVVHSNTSTGDLSGSNFIGDGALANSTGAFVAVQNVGNNVVIQTSLAVDVNFVQ